MTPLYSARFLNSEVLGSKFSAEVGMLFLQSDVDAVAVSAVAADGGETPNTINEDGIRVGEFSR